MMKFLLKLRHWQLFLLTWGLLMSMIFIGEVSGQNVEDVNLVEFSQSSCDSSSDPYRLKPRIISLKHFTDTLAIEIGFAATCCSNYVPNIRYSYDTLYMSYTATGDACSCACCYSFNHKITGISSVGLIVKLYNEVIELSDEKYRTYKPTFVIVKGDTLNRKDKYGQKQGIWIEELTIQKIERNRVTGKDNITFFRYNDSKYHNWGHLYPNLKIKDEYNAKTDLHQKFYNNGMKKMECYGNDDDQSTSCRRWKKNGRQIK